MDITTKIVDFSLKQKLLVIIISTVLLTALATYFLTARAMFGHDDMEIDRFDGPATSTAMSEKNEPLYQKNTR